jgi:hypothetical protein
VTDENNDIFFSFNSPMFLFIKFCEHSDECGQMFPSRVLACRLSVVVAGNTAVGARLTLVMSLARCQPTLPIRRRKNDRMWRGKGGSIRCKSRDFMFSTEFILTLGCICRCIPLPRGKAAWACIWPLTSIWFRGYNACSPIFAVP